MCILKCFLPVCTLPFDSLTGVIYRVDILGFNLKTFFFLLGSFLVFCLKSHHQSQGRLDFLLCYFVDVL